MAITWSTTNQNGSGKAVCTTGTETFAAGALDGVSCANAGAIEVFLEADSGQTLSGAGNLLAYALDDINGLWARAPDFDLAVTSAMASNRAATFIGPSAGKGIPVISKRGRMAYVPSGVTVSSGGVTIAMNLASARPGL